MKAATANLATFQSATLVLQLTAPEVIEAGLHYYLQGYDAVYFELARRLKAPLATLDGGIRTACAVHKVELLKFGG